MRWMWLGGLIVLTLLPIPARAEKCPNMMIVLDRSFSMSAGGKWTAALAAIAEFTPTRESVMRFGLRVFPSPGANCGGGLQAVPSDFYTAAAINAALLGISPGGSTPTSFAISSAGATPDLQDTTRPRFVILITDGDPTCPNENNVPQAQALTVTEIQKLAQAGVKTFVIGFGHDASPARLDEMAVAGQTARVNAQCQSPVPPGTIPCKYYDASDAPSLEVSLDAIAVAATGELSGTTCDDNCYGPGGCPTGQRCVANVTSYQGGAKLLNVGKCVADPCASVTCGPNQFCRDGSCYPACLDSCPAPKICSDGACVDDPCDFDPSQCVCTGGCARFLICLDQSCQDDPCRYISCPKAAPYCNLGSCYAASAPPLPGGDAGTLPAGDTGIRSDESSGGTGCTCTTASPLLLLPIALVSPWLKRRRRPL